MSYGPRSCSWRLRASTTTRSGPVWTPAARSSPSGANASSPSGSAASRSDPGEDGQASFPPEVVIEVKAIACELPSRLGLPLSRLQVPDIRDEVITRGLVAAISGTTIWRWHPTLAPAASRAMRVEHEYERGGALAYFAAWDVHQAKLFGRCAPTTGIAPFKRLVAQVMGSEPYASAKRVFWVVDNGSSHRGAASVRRLAADWPRAQLVHTPVHSSWLNQVEIYLSIVQRKCLTPNDFTDLAAVRRRLLAFERRYEQAAKPFEWKFTRADLALLIKRLAAKDDLPRTA